MTLSRAITPRIAATSINPLPALRPIAKQHLKHGLPLPPITPGTQAARSAHQAARKNLTRDQKRRVLQLGRTAKERKPLPPQPLKDHTVNMVVRSLRGGDGGGGEVSKDEAAAHELLATVRRRSLSFQYDVVDAVYRRAVKHATPRQAVEARVPLRPKMEALRKKEMKRVAALSTPELPLLREGLDERERAEQEGMFAAMRVQRDWLVETFPRERQKLRVRSKEGAVAGFRPVLSQDLVQGFLLDIAAALGKEIDDVDADSKTRDALDDEGEEAMERVNRRATDPLSFATAYVELRPNKRLGGKDLAYAAIDPRHPYLGDWERARYEALDKLVPRGKESAKDWRDEELWEAGQVYEDVDGREVVERRPTRRHLELIAWAWSPVGAEGFGVVPRHDN